MQVLLTGSAGFIGRAVTDRLAGSGIDLVRYDRSADVRDDVTDLTRVTEAVRGCEAVVHLAAKVGLGIDLSDLDTYVRANDVGTATVLRAAAEAGVGRVVYASSMVVYGEGGYRCRTHGAVRPGPRRVADLQKGRFDPPCPHCLAPLTPTLVVEEASLDPRNVYAATKVHGESLCRIWARETGGTVAALRFHNVYGPGMPRDTPYAGVAALFRSSLAAGRAPQVYEDGRQRRDFVHVRDVAAAVARATTAPLPSGICLPLNIGSGTVTTVGEVARLLSVLVDGPPPRVTGQYRLGDVRHITADSAAARRTLGWGAELTLAQGLALGL